MEDEKIIELFWSRSETAIRSLDQKYGTLCRSLSMNILSNPMDAEECVNDAYLGVMKSMSWSAGFHPRRFFLRRLK